MKEITFPYKEERSRLFGTIHRPIARAELKSKAEWIPTLMYVDSGADITLIPRSLGELLGFKIEAEEKIVNIGGIGGAIPAIVKKASINLGGEILEARVAWALVEDIPPLLGRTDVFDNFEVDFRQKEKKVIFRRG